MSDTFTSTASNGIQFALQLKPTSLHGLRVFVCSGSTSSIYKIQKQLKSLLDDNGITCHESNPSQGMFNATNNTGYCPTMSTYDTTLGANYHEATKTFQFIINNGAQRNIMQ
eukprot:490092_1